MMSINGIRSVMLVQVKRTWHTGANGSNNLIHYHNVICLWCFSSLMQEHPEYKVIFKEKAAKERRHFRPSAAGSHPQLSLGATAAV